MIIKSGDILAPACVAQHLLKTKDNDGEKQEVSLVSGRHVPLFDEEGQQSQKVVYGAVYCMDAIGKAFGKSRTLFSVSCSPEENQEMTREDFDTVREMFEQEYKGLSRQPLLIIEHTKKGRTHQHWLYALVKENGTSINTWHNYARNEKVARMAEYELNHPLTMGKFNCSVIAHLRAEGRGDVADWMEMNKAHEKPRPISEKNHADYQQETRIKILVKQVKEDLKTVYGTTRNGAEFITAIAPLGYQLARGKRGFVVVDSAGGVHSPPRRLNIKAAELRQKWADINPDNLPTVAETQHQRDPPKKYSGNRLFVSRQEKESVRRNGVFLQSEDQYHRQQRQQQEQQRFIEIAKTSYTFGETFKGDDDDTTPLDSSKNISGRKMYGQKQTLSHRAKNAAKRYYRVRRLGRPRCRGQPSRFRRYQKTCDRRSSSQAKLGRQKAVISSQETLIFRSDFLSSGR